MKDARWIAEAAGAELRGEAEAPSPKRAVIDSREAGPGDLFVGLTGENTDGGEFAEKALAQGAWGVLTSGALAPGVGVSLTARRPAGGPAGARARVAPRARRAGDRHHRLHRQDLHQGHPARPAHAAPAHARQPPEPQHRDRVAAVDPGGAAGDRGAGARDGHARRGADRRAGGGGRARRGRDRERRPGAPGAAGHGRAGGRRQGRAGARPAARARAACCPPRSRCWTPTAATTSTTGPSARAATCRWSASRAGGPRWRRAGERIELEPAFEEPHNLLNMLAGVAAARALERVARRAGGAGVLVDERAKWWSSPTG